MKKILLMLLFMLPTVMAVNTTIPINYDVTVDFDGNTDFRILLPYGKERHFAWDSNETHSDVTYKATLYYDFIEEDVCTKSQSQIQQYMNISESFISVTQMCSSLLEGFNSSYGFNGQLWKSQNERLKNEENRSGTYLSSLDICKEEKEKKGAELATCTAQVSELNKCKSDLSSELKSTDKWIFALVGIGLGYALWGRRKKRGPSEQVESGYVGDQTRDIEFESRQIDGPKE